MGIMVKMESVSARGLVFSARTGVFDMFHDFLFKVGRNASLKSFLKGKWKLQVPCGIRYHDFRAWFSDSPRYKSGLARLCWGRCPHPLHAAGSKNNLHLRGLGVVPTLASFGHQKRT